ncbi:MAG: lipocalin family protein [Gammaproteobacteria bacterium]|nr:lipocalin family protein [Gammaproteobacteria bacterium]
MPSALFAAAALTACASHPPMPGVAAVDLDRFMGDWYVIASIPTPFEKNIYNAVERYDRVGPAKIQTTFTYRKGSFDGEQGVMTPTGYVDDDGSNALWKMQFIWPIRSDYRIVYLDADYRTTVIARRKRDYVWIMAREPAVSDNEYDALVQQVAALGYDISELKPVPQQWEDAR